LPEQEYYKALGASWIDLTWITEELLPSEVIAHSLWSRRIWQAPAMNFSKKSLAQYMFPQPFFLMCYNKIVKQSFMWTIAQ